MRRELDNQSTRRRVLAIRRNDPINNIHYSNAIYDVIINNALSITTLDYHSIVIAPLTCSCARVNARRTSPNWKTSFCFPFVARSSFNREFHDRNWFPNIPSYQFSSLSLSPPLTTIQFFSRVSLASSFLSLSLFLPAVENPYTILADPSGQVQREVQVRRVVCSLFGENRRAGSRFTALPSSTFADVLPLSSRKKFFYNFRIVLFCPSSFF